MTIPHTRPAPPGTDEIDVELGIDDIILSYSSDYWIAPYHDDGIQRWDVGMHFTEDGPGPQFGRIALHLVDHDRCSDPIYALDALSKDLSTIGKVLFDASLDDLRQDLWEDITCPGSTLIVDQVTLDSRLRGHGLGVFLTGMALDYLSSSSGVIALFPGPIERENDTPYQEACARLGKAWSRLGFFPYRDGVWVLDPALTTLNAAIAAEQQRLAPHRWRVTLAEHPQGWGSVITGISALMSKTTPWARPPFQL